MTAQRDKNWKGHARDVYRQLRELSDGGAPPEAVAVHFQLDAEVVDLWLAEPPTHWTKYPPAVLNEARRQIRRKLVPSVIARRLNMDPGLVAKMARDERKGREQVLPDLGPPTEVQRLIDAGVHSIEIAKRTRILWVTVRKWLPKSPDVAGPLSDLGGTICTRKRRKIVARR